MKKTGLNGYVYDFSADYDAVGFIKKCFFTTMMLSCSVLNAISLQCTSRNNQECKARPEVININSNEPLFYPYSILVTKCSGSCNNINAPFAKLCVFDVVKRINVKVFNLMSITNETRYIGWHETCRCKCRLDASVCNNKKGGIKIDADVNAKN